MCDTEQEGVDNINDLTGNGEVNETDVKDENKDEIKDEIKNDELPVMLLPSSHECKCGESNFEDDLLYVCEQKGCEHFKYCDECIDFEHEKSKKKGGWKKGHKLDTNKVKCINDFFEETPDGKRKCKYGENALRKLAGQSVYKQVSPYLLKGGGVVASAGLLTALAFETKAIVSVTTNLLYHGTHLGAHAMLGGAIAGVFWAGELIQNSMSYSRGEICFEELGKRTAMSTVRHGALFGCGSGGAKIGAMIGTAIAPGIGTIVGGFAGALIGLIVGYFAGKKLSGIIDDTWKVAESEATQKTKKELKEALLWFHFIDDNVINDATQFNEKILKRKYKSFLLECHPDRPNGSHNKFLKLNLYYGILKALCTDVSKRARTAVLNDVQSIQ